MYIKYECNIEPIGNSYKLNGALKTWNENSPYFHAFDSVPETINGRPFLKYTWNNYIIDVNVKRNIVSLKDIKILLESMLSLKKIYGIDNALSDDLFNIIKS